LGASVTACVKQRAAASASFRSSKNRPSARWASGSSTASSTPARNAFSLIFASSAFRAMSAACRHRARAAAGLPAAALRRASPIIPSGPVGSAGSAGAAATAGRGGAAGTARDASFEAGREGGTARDSAFRRVSSHARKPTARGSSGPADSRNRRACGSPSAGLPRAKAWMT
jgi:hypothetical protein